MDKTSIKTMTKDNESYDMDYNIVLIIIHYCAHDAPRGFELYHKTHLLQIILERRGLCTLDRVLTFGVLP